MCRNKARHVAGEHRSPCVPCDCWPALKMESREKQSTNTMTNSCLRSAASGPTMSTESVVPWTVNGSCGLQPVTIIAPFLTLWATLGHRYTDTAASLVGVAVAKQLPQSLASEVWWLCVAPELTGELPLPNPPGCGGECPQVEQDQTGKTTESVHVGLNFTRTMAHGEIRTPPELKTSDGGARTPCASFLAIGAHNGPIYTSSGMAMR